MPVQRSRLRITDRGANVAWFLMIAAFAVCCWLSR